MYFLKNYHDLNIQKNYFNKITRNFLIGRLTKYQKKNSLLTRFLGAAKIYSVLVCVANHAFYNVV